MPSDRGRRVYDDDDDYPRRVRPRRPRRPGPDAALIVALGVGAVLLLVLVLGGGLAAWWLLGRPAGGGPGLPGLGLTSHPIGLDDYIAIRDGATLADVQARLGPGERITIEESKTVDIGPGFQNFATKNQTLWEACPVLGDNAEWYRWRSGIHELYVLIDRSRPDRPAVRVKLYFDRGPAPTYHYAQLAGR